MKPIWMIVLGLILVGCEVQATPIAAGVESTNTPSADTALVSETTLPIFRYAVASNLVPYVGDIPAYEVFDSSQPLAGYDLVVAYGIYDGWQQAPQPHRVSLAVNPNLSPLDNASMRDLIPQIIDVQSIVSNLNIPSVQETSDLPTTSVSAVRTTLANAGYPDGFQLIMATETVPSRDALVSQFLPLSLDIRLIELNETILTDNVAHLVLFLWSNDSERATLANQFGDDNIIDLWTLPISYIASDDVVVNFSDNGIPTP